MNPRAALVAELDDIRAAATSAASSADAIQSVDAARKALRRARALWTMIEEALPKKARKKNSDGLKEARRALSWANGDALAPKLLAELDFSDADRATLDRVKANATSIIPPITEVLRPLQEAAAIVGSQSSAIEGVLDERFGWNEIIDGIKAQYEEARDRRRGAKGSRSEFHRWRRRVKELSIQLAFVAKHAPGAAEIAKEFDEVTSASSAAVDYSALRSYVKDHSHGIEVDTLEPILEAIDRKWKEARERALSAGRAALGDKPKKLAKRLREAVAAPES